MIDQSTPSISLILYKDDSQSYPCATLPKGYSFAFYRDGDERHWAEIECAVGQFSSIEDGEACFAREFLSDAVMKPHDHTLFVVDPQGNYVATASLWCWNFLGKPCYRAHWLAVVDRCAGLGIAQALLARVLALFNERYGGGRLYLLTSTRYYPAIYIYHKFGFVEYNDSKSPDPNLSDEDFTARNTQALTLLAQKLEAFRRGK
ncbi:MAG: GNAT family N-acetyltransferase [Clostridia bacterium]|nr:GNAT family N-acetyltransferase [Clostridia bacterium]